jgi:excisionase family DNA binding protein
MKAQSMPSAAPPDAAASLTDALRAIIRDVVREEIRAALSEQKPESFLLDADGAAGLLSVPRSWVAEAAREGKIPAVRLGHYVRFRRVDLEKLIGN